MKKILFFSLSLLIVLSACAKTGEVVIISVEEAKAKSLDFVNEILLQGTGKAEIIEVTEEDSFYKVAVKLEDGREITSGITKDGKNFFPNVMNIADEEETASKNASDAQAQQAATLADIEKKDKPEVEVFVMSHCPYGTQIEKGVIPVAKELGDAIDFKIRFCDYAMHGEPELTEQLNQVCIQQEEPDKFLDYLECFLADADSSDECMSEAGINKSNISSCVKEVDQEYKVMELFADQSSWKSGRYPQFNVHQAEATEYGITGSPGLVVNGKKISSGRDSASLLKTICSGFSEAPDACSAELSAQTPAPGFGYSATGGAATNAGCGS